MRYEPPGTRSIQEANEREQRRLAALAPVTWLDVLVSAGFTALCLAAPFFIAQEPKMERWSPWPEALILLIGIGLVCATVALG
jgi:hypothetical protein